MGQRSVILLLALTVLLSAPLTVSAMGTEDLKELQSMIWDKIDQSREPDCKEKDCGTPLLAQLVRLAFHDCVGGCDGVLDTSFPANAGLKVPIDALETVFHSFKEKTSSDIGRADFWALAGTMALYKGASNQICDADGAPPAWPTVPFMYGRLDGSGPADESKDFPNPHLGIDHVVTWAKRVFAFKKRDAVAIMGAHTLGRARRYNSGFEHTWTSTPDTLDNSYYADMIDKGHHLDGWDQVLVEASDPASPKIPTFSPCSNHTATDRTMTLQNPRKGAEHYQWVHHSDDEGLMLNTDMCLYLDIDPKTGKKKEGKVSCHYEPDAPGEDLCPLQKMKVGPGDDMEDLSVSELVELYADDPIKWMADFSSAFAMMIQTDTDSLISVPYSMEKSCRSMVSKTVTDRGTADPQTPASPNLLEELVTGSVTIS